VAVVTVSIPRATINDCAAAPEPNHRVQAPRSWGSALLILTVFSFGVLMWLGSYHPDPFYYSGGYGERALLKGVPAILHVAIPVLTILLSVGIAFGVVTRVRVLLVTLGVTFGGLALVLAVAGYKLILPQPLTHRLESYHAFLQLNPSDTQNHRQLFQLKASADKENTLTIAFLGGSTTEFTDSAGIGWPTKVGERIVVSLGEGQRLGEVSVINAGRQWYSSLHILHNYLTNVRPAKPDVIVFMEAVNDLFCNASFSYLSKGEFRSDYGHYMGATSRLLTGQNGLTDLIAYARGAFFHNPRNEIAHAPLPGLGAYARNIETLIDIAQVDGTQVVLATQPSVYRQGLPAEESWRLSMLNFEGIGPMDRWTIQATEEGMNSYNQALRAVGARRSVAVIELATSVPKTYEYFSDDVHYTDKGHELVAAAMTSGLLPLVLARVGR
jgi:hypothetical protein